MKIKSLILVFIVLISVFAICSCFLSNDDDDYFEGTEIITTYLKIYHPKGYSSEMEFSPEHEEASIYIPFHSYLYDFDGYYTEENGKGIKACDSEGRSTKEFRDYCIEHKNELISIYPLATPKKCTITFINQYGEAPDPIITDCDDDIDLPMDLTRTGYYFRGWSSYPDAWTGSDYLMCDFPTFTLYAIFDPITVEVICDGAAASIMRNRIDYDSDYTLGYTDKHGYNFVGYFSEENGGGTQYTDDTGKSLFPWNVEVRDYSTVYVYAHYIPAEKYTVYIPKEYIKEYVTVTYVDFYGEGKGDLQKTYSESNPIKYLKPHGIPEGYIFEGWYLDSRLTKKFTYDTVITDDITLYPKTYKPSSYYLSLGYFRINDDNGYSFSIRPGTTKFAKFVSDYSGYLTITATLDCPYDETVTLSILNISKNDGKTFNYIENGTTIEYKIKVEEDDLLELQMWGHVDNGTKDQVLKVTFSGISMTGRNAEVDLPEMYEFSVTQGNRYSLPYRADTIYTFKGYFTEPNGQGTRLTDKEGNGIGDYIFGEDIYAYAYFVKEE